MVTPRFARSGSPGGSGLVVVQIRLKSALRAGLAHHRSRPLAQRTVITLLID